MKKAVENNIQRYETYKDSGVEWLGEIPEHWEVKKFKFVLNQSKGLTITKQNLISEGIFCVNYGEIHSKFGFELDTSKHKLKCVNEEYLKTDSNSLLNKGDFVFADTSEDIEGSGNFTHLRSSDKIFAGYHTVIARPKIEIESLFLAFVFDSTSFRNQIRKKVKGVKVYSITQSVLKETNVWIPPLQEQTKIAQFLDDKTTKIDAAIGIKEQQINLLKERKQILIHKAVTRGLDDTVALKDSGVEWVGEIPEHWEVKPLKYIGNSIIGLTYSPNNLCKEDEGTLVFRSSNLFEGKIKYGEKENVYVNSRISNKLMVRENDILICSRNGSRDLIGKCALISKVDIGASFGAFTTVFRSDINPYIFCILNSSIFKALSGSFLTSTINQLTIGNLNSIFVPVPPQKEREILKVYINNFSDKIETTIDLKEQEIAKLKEYKSSLINSVVTGKVKVC